MNYVLKAISYFLLTAVSLLVVCFVMALPSLMAGLALFLFWNYFLSAFALVGIPTVAFLDCWASAFLIGVFFRSFTINADSALDKNDKNENKE